MIMSDNFTVSYDKHNNPTGISFYGQSLTHQEVVDFLNERHESIQKTLDVINRIKEYEAKQS